MYTIVQLKQGTPQWHAYRQSRRNASESAAVLGLSPWMTPYQLWLVKTGRLQTPATAAMQRCIDPVNSCSGVNVEGNDDEHPDGRRHQALDSQA